MVRVCGSRKRSRCASANIDFERREIIVRNSRTGRRDRTTILPEAIIPALKRHLDKRPLSARRRLSARLRQGLSAEKQSSSKYPNAGFDWHWQFVFPSHNLTVGTKRSAVIISPNQPSKKRSAKRFLRANIFKQACCQTFRYSFAARLFEKNYDIRRIQTLLGHKNLKTTVIYMQFARCAGNSRAKSAG